MAVSSPLRVLHVYSGNLYGGIETFLRALAEERDKCPDMQPEFALCFEGRIADELRASGAPLHMLGGVRLSRPWSVHSARKKLAAVLRTRRPDVVICHAAWPYAIFSSVVRAARTRLVFYRHDIGGAKDWMNLLAGRVQPDVVIANSQYTAKHAYPKFEGVEQHVVYPVVRPAKTEPGDRARIRKELGAEDGDVVILQASRMQAWKGQALLIDALGLLPKDLPWKCWLAGDAQRDFEKAYVADLKVKVANHKIEDRVRFLGQRSDVPVLMQGADIFCQPNLSPEPFGIVFVEALAAGVLVVTTDVAGGALEILDDQCGRSCAAEASHLEATLRHFALSGEVRARFGSRCVDRARSLTGNGISLHQLARAATPQRRVIPVAESLWI